MHYCGAVNSLREAENERLALLSERDRLRAQVCSLGDRLESGADDAQIEAMARERLGLVMPGEPIYYFTDEESKKDKEG